METIIKKITDNEIENDKIINIDLSYDIVTLWDTKDGKLNRSDTFILQ